MPKREDLKKVLVIGSGPIVIGQACEFDYSGTQACRVLKEEGLQVVLVNSNPATIMTDPEFADATYIEPITLEALRQIIAKERPDALLPTLGGQTALNAAVALHESGVLEQYGVKLIGAQIKSITAGEDREEFKKVVERCGASVARSQIAHNMEEYLAAAAELQYPVVVRPSFTMGGLGSGIARTEADLHHIAGAGLRYSPTTEVLLEESVIGWKEFELEIMRDKADNVVVVCSIENLDPMGVHTGDSITVAPALTLTDREYQHLRDIGIAVIREVGVDTGGCNIQFAVNPVDGRVLVIEMNPRVSRSSALASKATGFPIAKIAARLAIGYTLDEIVNDITGTTPASFEPSIDYIVTKVPRFAFEKFPAADDTLTTTMKSVGEAMAIGRTFTESLGKAMRSIDKKDARFHWRGERPSAAQLESLVASTARPSEHRLVDVQQAIRWGTPVDRLAAATGIDPWFLDQIQLINEVAAEVANSSLAPDVLARAKRHGLSDEQIAEIRGISEQTIREMRHAYGLRPVYKMVDTCAGEFAARTPYLYSAYELETEVRPREKPAVIILGSGPNRIGQGIEFDYSCVHASLALGGEFETVMVNCNPETVSTDYDISGRLYFEPLTFEDVMEVYDAERSAGRVAGVIVQLGGQTPLSLASRLADAGVPMWGTPPEAIDAAENRGLFGQVLAAAGLPAPQYGTALSIAEARTVAARIGYPVLVRPSYVLGGRGMEIVYDEARLEEYMAKALPAGGRADAPVLIDRFLDSAIEIDVDALFDGEELFLGGVMEHIEEAGIHSGDSACVLPPVTLSSRDIARIRASTEAIARGVGVRGLINIQFALMGDVLYVLEANPRASRTVPFVSKATGVPLAKAACLIMAGRSIADLRRSKDLPETDSAAALEGGGFAVKEAVLPFARFRTAAGETVDTLLGPEMRSTGEVMGRDWGFPAAFAKSQMAAYGGLPEKGSVFVSVADRDKRSIIFPVKKLADLGFSILATEGTASMLRRNSIKCTAVAKVSDKRPGRHVVDLINAGEVDMVVNTPSGAYARADGYEIRAAITAMNRPIVTTTQQLGAAVQAIEARAVGEFKVAALQGGPVALERAATAPRAKVSGASRSASFGERLARAMSDRSHLCVGIDPHPESLAEWGLTDTPAGVERFGEALVRAAAEGGAAAVKPQSAFFERHGEAGIAVLGRLLASARAEGLLTILDVKRGDIGSTMAAYASAYLDDAAPLAADAVTVSPYLGFGSLTPALDAAASSGRCVFVLALTSNPEGATVQHAAVGPGMGVGESMIEAATAWNTAWLERQAGVGGGAEGEQLGPVGLVIGATIKALPPLGARLIAQFRGPILVPGVGAQGGQPAELAGLFGPAGRGVLVTSSRALANAGPGPAKLVEAVRVGVQNVAFLGN